MSRFFRAAVIASLAAPSGSVLLRAAGVLRLLDTCGPWGVRGRCSILALHPCCPAPSSSRR